MASFLRKSFPGVHERTFSYYPMPYTHYKDIKVLHHVGVVVGSPEEFKPAGQPIRDQSLQIDFFVLSGSQKKDNKFVHLLLVAPAFTSQLQKDDDKVLIMLEFEPIKAADRTKRASAAEAARPERQSPEQVPPEYLGLLQQYSAQQQQQASASAQQPQQQLIQQLVVSRDGSRQPTAARYVLTQDGRLIDESSLGLGQQQQLAQSFGGLAQPQFLQDLSQPQQLQQLQGQQGQQLQQISQAQAQALGLQAYQQNPLQSTQPLQIPPAPAQQVRPGQRPQISEFARQQQRILQEVRDAPLRAQIAGLTIRPPNNPVQQVPTGPNSQSPQVFAPAGQTPQQQQQQAQQRQLQQLQQQQQIQQQIQQAQAQQLGLTPYQDPQNPNIVYTPVPVDPQTYQLQLQQQLAAQYGIEADPRQVFAQRPASPVSQQLFYQPQIPQDFSQDKIRRPITVLPAQSANQPQVVPQAIPQQYLIETTKPSTPQPPQFVSSDASPQIQYVQQPVQQPVQQQPTPIRQPEPAQQQSTLLQPVAGRGLFTPVKPSRSSIFVSRSSAPKSVSLTISDDVTSEKVPVVRLPTPQGQRPLSKQELDALVSAGYAVSPIQDPQQYQYLKAKRQPVAEERRNHVVYENPQDGVQYQYSPGSSDGTVTIKTKNSA